MATESQTLENVTTSEVVTEELGEIPVRYVSIKMHVGENYLFAKLEKDSDGFLRRIPLSVEVREQDNDNAVFEFSGQLPVNTILYVYEGVTPADIYVVKPLQTNIFEQGLEHLGDVLSEDVQKFIKQTFGVPRILWAEPLHEIWVPIT